jgi:hypothetical protein
VLSIRKAIANWRSNSSNRLFVTNSTLVTVIEHIIYFAGLASITYGAWLAYHPLGFIIGGGLAVHTSFSIVAERAFAERTRRNKLEE